LLDSIGQLFVPVRGGLSYAVIFVGAILGAITGTVAASVIAMGVISMTPMLKYGYSTRHTMGVIARSPSSFHPRLSWSCWPISSAAPSATCTPER
jgi:TRAP-type mannitol/chloroaromatic compound transport system permease large subunit